MCRHFSLRLWIPRYSPLVWQQIAGKMRVMYYVCWSRNYVLLEVCFAAHCRSFIVAVIRPRSLFSSPPFRSLRSGNCIMNGALLSAQRLTPEPFPFRLTSTTERRREKNLFTRLRFFFCGATTAVESLAISYTSTNPIRMRIIVESEQWSEAAEEKQIAHRAKKRLKTQWHK